MTLTKKVKQYLQLLQEDLYSLKQDNQAVSLKAGTEVEDLSFHEITIFKILSEGLMPLTVKIGGAEARQDIREMLELKVDCILSPMIESVYALKKFVETVISLSQEYDHNPRLAFNLETVSAVRSLDSLLESEAFARIDRVTIGRGDLSQSMHLSMQDDEVINVSKEAIKKIKNLNKQTSFGGGLSLSNIKELSQKIPSDFFNTRHILFKNDIIFQTDPIKTLFKILNWEKKLCNLLCMVSPQKKEYHKKRIYTLSKRLNKVSLAG